MDAVAWNHRGWAYAGLKQWDKALADYSKAIELDPKYAAAWKTRGWTYNELHQYDKAIADLNKAIEVDPKYAAAWNNRGNAYFGLKQNDKAVADYTKAIELDPKDAVVWSNRGNTYRVLKQNDKAVADYTKAIELDPKNAMAWNNRGHAYNGIKQYDKAIADFSKAIELDLKLAWYNRGATYAGLKQWDKAIADYSKAIELNPKNAYLWHVRALVCLRAGDRDGYRKDCARMLEHFGETQDQVTAFWVAWTCVLASDAVTEPERVVQVAEKAVAKDPNKRQHLDALGAALYRAGRFDEAAKRLSEANAAKLDAYYTPVHTWLFLAMTHHRLGHADEARQWLDKAVQAIDEAANEPAKPEAGPSGKANETQAGTPLRWDRRLTFQLLRREAEELIAVKKQKE
jgi:tetratricopeptide (TPR) repeat protein